MTDTRVLELTHVQFDAVTGLARFEDHDAWAGGRADGLTMPFQRWRNLGSPEKISVTVEAVA